MTLTRWQSQKKVSCSPFSVSFRQIFRVFIFANLQSFMKFTKFTSRWIFTYMVFVIWVHDVGQQNSLLEWVASIETMFTNGWVGGNSLHIYYSIRARSLLQDVFCDSVCCILLLCLTPKWGINQSSEIASVCNFRDLNIICWQCSS